MMGLRELARRLNMLLNRRQFDANLEEDIRLHLKLREQEQLDAGACPDVEPQRTVSSAIAQYSSSRGYAFPLSGCVVFRLRRTLGSGGSTVPYT
jgi:hypothetical protein